MLTVALGLLLGGAIGNLLDRLRFGHVVDFVDMGIGSTRWYTWNVADAAISIAIVLLLAHGLLGHRLGRWTGNGRAAAPGPPADHAPEQAS
jgi:signal peptidase II